ncbi:ATP-binding cassette sub- G member 2 [Phlyctochytrium bullatum]|nr:ATP-binding cassette sub- G member 2 [Phlyctochytrium bullatum]
MSTILGGPKSRALSPDPDGKPSRMLRQRLSTASGLDLEAQQGAVVVSESNALAPNEWPNSWVKELAILTHRSLKDTVRDRVVVIASFARSVVLVLLIGLSFFNLQPDQRGVGDRFGILFFWPINVLFTTIIPTVSVFPDHRLIMRRERATWSYRVSSFFLAKLFVELMYSSFFSVLSSLPLYFLMGLRRNVERIGWWVVVHLIVSMCAVSVGFFVGAAVPSSKVGKVVAPVVVIIFLIFGGGLINVQNLSYFFKIFNWISPVTYAFRANMQNEFIGLNLQCSQEPCYRVGDQVVNLYAAGDLSIPVCVGALGGLFLGYLLLAYLVLRFGGRPKMRLA